MSFQFGESLKAARLHASLTQQELADMIGVKRKQIISNWEKGIVEPNIETLLRLADCLNVSLDHLLGRSLTRYKQLALDSGIPAIDIHEIRKSLGPLFSYPDHLEQLIYLLLYKSHKDAYTLPHAVDDEEFEEIMNMGLSDEAIEARLKDYEEREAKELLLAKKSRKL
jgi:transcriptional regulator with XRE-family HTH domain